MKIGISTILAIIALVLVFLGFWTQPGIAPLVIGLMLVIVFASSIGIIHIGKAEEKGTRTINALIAGVAVLLILNVGSYLGTPTQTFKVPAQEVKTVEGQAGTAILKLNVKNSIGGTYANTGTIYGLKSGIVSNRNDLMKRVQDGNTADLAPNAMSLSSGVYSYNGYSAKIGDEVVYAGYVDNSPGAGENISFVITTKITGITGGSTPEWMLDNSQYVWYSYPTLAFYEPTSWTTRNRYVEYEASAIERTFKVDMFPTLDGQQWIDSALYIEAPSSNAGAFKKVKITCDGCTPVEYQSSLQSTGQMSSGDPRFIAAPALNTSTDTMYYVGQFPADLVRTSTTKKAVMTLEITYDHPASGNVRTFLFVTQNSNALTVSGGHFDSPSTNFLLNMTATNYEADTWYS